MWIEDYKVEEYNWAEGNQHDESYLNGYRIRVMIDDMKFYSDKKYTSLDDALKVIELFKMVDGK